MADRYSTISFLSDFGITDEFVGVVKSVIRSIAPDATVIDLTHSVPPHDVRAASLTLARSVQYLAAGVVLAVVDPGVGGERRAVAVEVGDGESVLVGPDNGLLAPAVAMVGGATRAVHLTNADYQLPSPGATFGGRDVFGPAAAHLCAGVPLDELGPLIDPGGLLPGVLPVSQPEGEGLACEVFWVDRYGNAQLNVGPEEVAAWGGRIGLKTGGQERSAAIADSYAELGTGEVGLVIDSYGLLSVALDRRSAADELGLTAGSPVTLHPLADGAVGISRPVSTPVTLRRSP